MSIKTPYSKNDIEKYEKKIKSNLPDDLKQYFTTVSKEISHPSKFPTLFKLDANCVIESFDIPNSVISFELDHKRFDAGYKGMVVIGEYSKCGMYDFIVIKGLCKGSVWFYNGNYNKIASSFTEYMNLSLD